MNRVVPICLAAALVSVMAACSRSDSAASADPAIDLTGGWVRATPGGSDITAAYFTLTNSGGADRLTGVSSDQLDRAELHASSTGDDGVMRMEHLDGLDVPAGAEVSLAPGGNHLMLYGANGVTLGDTICLTLDFEVSGQRIACLPVMDDAPL